jgi:hypothetical protein
MKKEHFGDPAPMHIQSNGMGVQSFAMYLMSSMGLLPRFDYSVFVNTGGEKQKTLEAFEWLKKWAVRNNGVPLIEITKRNLLAETLSSVENENQRFVSVPFFADGEKEREGMLRRQCTGEIKIRQVNAFIKAKQELYGNQRFKECYVYLGISIDEMSRMSTPKPIKFTNVFPFCGYQTGYRRGVYRFGEPGHITLPLSRNQIKNWLIENFFIVPPKSSCVWCPYTTNAEWAKMKRENGSDWQTATLVDSKIRNGHPGGVNKTLACHRSLAPLNEVDFESEIDHGLFECSGHCHC